MQTVRTLRVHIESVTKSTSTKMLMASLEFQRKNEKKVVEEMEKWKNVNLKFKECFFLILNIVLNYYSFFVSWRANHLMLGPLKFIFVHFN